ncbi:Nn.00g075750.m01.CDS01 [Neocucurbitaria sp. VM-36]
MPTSMDISVRQVLEEFIPKFRERRQSLSRPIVLGITGLQGSGKSTVAAKIVQILSSEYHIHAITVSLDDFYKTHVDLIAQRDKDPTNKLYLTRGQPGTHDEGLAAEFFEKMKSQADGELRIPSFDKSKYNGEGDRAPRTDWPVISGRPDVVVFEGWCLGFQPISDLELKEKHALAQAGKLPLNTPAQHQLKHLSEVNENLKQYCSAFMGPQHFDFFFHIDTHDLRNVYTWRLEQEHKMIEAKGSGMSDEQVRAFIDGYMPSYEIYLNKLREGLFEDKGRMVRFVLDVQRAVESKEEL